MPAFMLIFSLPLVIANWIAPIVAFCWLVYLGDYGILITAAVASFAASFAYALAMIPSMAIILPGYYLLKKSVIAFRAVGYILVGIGGFWSYTLMGAWTLFVFNYEPNAVIDRSLPYLLLAYGVSIAPFSYMASKEPADNWGAAAATLLNQLSALVLLVLLAFSKLHLGLIALIFIAIIVIGYLTMLIGGLVGELTKNMVTD